MVVEAFTASATANGCGSAPGPTAFASRRREPCLQRRYLRRFLDHLRPDASRITFRQDWWLKKPLEWAAPSLKMVLLLFFSSFRSVSMLRSPPRRRAAFTLIELLVVIA